MRDIFSCVMHFEMDMGCVGKRSGLLVGVVVDVGRTVTNVSILVCIGEGGIGRGSGETTYVLEYGNEVLF